MFLYHIYIPITAIYIMNGILISEDMFRKQSNKPVLVCGSIFIYFTELKPQEDLK